MSKEIQALKFKLKDAEDKNKKFKAKFEDYENIIKEKDKAITTIREEFAVSAGQSDYINISYYLGDQAEDKLIQVNSPKKSDYNLSLIHI